MGAGEQSRLLPASPKSLHASQTLAFPYHLPLLLFHPQSITDKGKVQQSKALKISLSGLQRLDYVNLRVTRVYSSQTNTLSTSPHTRHTISQSSPWCTNAPGSQGGGILSPQHAPIGSWAQHPQAELVLDVGLFPAESPQVAKQRKSNAWIALQAVQHRPAPWLWTTIILLCTAE